jgi:Zn-dependent membrane protease YugP
VGVVGHYEVFDHPGDAPSEGGAMSAFGIEDVRRLGEDISEGLRDRHERRRRVMRLSLGTYSLSSLAVSAAVASRAMGP